MGEISVPSHLRYTEHQYGASHDLQRVGVWEVDTADKMKPWVIYIHGGAWRDPRIGQDSFGPTIAELTTHAAQYGNVLGRVAGLASIDYRLSPHPDLPQDPQTTPARSYRNAQHPDHLDDVRAAVAFLQSTYAFGRRYVIVGHSAGACLAMQLVAFPQGVALPSTIIGVAGIYDFSGINARTGGAYAGFLGGAFGHDQTRWDAAAPRTWTGNFHTALGDGAHVTLARSAGDELVDEAELDNMAARLQEEGCAVAIDKGLHGKHDACWEEGHDLAQLIGECAFLS